jgi:hypothetical protein
MTKWDRWLENLKETAQPHCDGEVLAVGLLQPPGGLGTVGLGQLSPLAAMIKARGGNEAAGGLAKTSTFRNWKHALLAVTADKVYAFEAKPRGRGWKIKGQSGVWARADLKVELNPGKLATQVSIDVTTTGEHYDLEATTIGPGVNKLLLEVLAAAP